MTYMTMRDGLITLLQGITGFSELNVAYEDYQALNAGVSRAIIVEYGGFSQRRESFGGGDFAEWMFDVDLYNQFGDTIQAQREQDSDRESILQRIRVYPKLNGTAKVFEAYAERGQPDQFPVVIGSARFIKEKIIVRVIEDIQVTELE